ncbi:MAG: hypothetical protein KA168_06025 [Chitinophagales bacterium]|jgi:hypothetical protein|nr:hypothetical protein [Chitinophagales bacterium]
METTFHLESNTQEWILHIPKNNLSEDWLLQLIKRIELENLLQKANFSTEILALSEKIQENWWERNRVAFLNDVIQ